MRFANREEAGKKLAEKLLKYREKPNVIIYALPRGGVPVAYEIAMTLKAPLDLAITRKIGHPFAPEYAIAAVAEGGGLVKNEAEATAFDPEWFKAAVKREQREIDRRRKEYLGNQHAQSARGKIAIVVDDGVATGLTLRAALQALRKQRPERLIAAVPVAPTETAKLLREECDEFVVLEDGPSFLGSVGAYYADFPQLKDAEVRALLDQSQLSL